MEKFITDQRTGLRYELVGDYYLIAGDRVHYALASAFCVCRKDGGLILKS